MPTATTTTASSADPTAELKKLALNGTTNGATPTDAQVKELLKTQWFSQTGLNDSHYPYAHYKPIWDKTKTYPPLEEFEHVDPGLKALEHAHPRAFLDKATVKDLTPRLGSEVEGIQLSELDDEGRQQLALYVAQRGAVAFRDQDFIDKDPEWLIHNWGAFFGRPHIHQAAPEPAGHPELLLVYRAPQSDINFDYNQLLSSVRWHSDVSFEVQPPGLTALFLFDSPEAGGDTGYLDQREAYRRFSPAFQSYLETLQVVHTGFEQAEAARRGERGALGFVRREPIETAHPLVRTHPVTGEKALFVNPGFARRVVGYKQQESDALLKFLFDHLEKGVDFQTRLSWKPRTVVLWDNRITAHTAIADFDHVAARRHGARVTPQAERPRL